MDPRTVLALTLATVLLAGCFGKPRVIVEPQIVNVPVPVRVQPPEEWRKPMVPAQIPEFIPVDHPEARAALSREGIRQYQTMIYDLTVRLREWEAWGFEKEVSE